MTVALLLLALAAVVAGAELFTNGLEHVGARFRLSQGVTGSVFAAVATALPEAIVPVVAILGPGSQLLRSEIATGAILGAPLMLSTLALFLTGVAAFVTRGPRTILRPEQTGLRRDLLWFLAGFGLSTLAAMVPAQITWLRAAIAGALVVSYGLYLRVTFQASRALVAGGHGVLSPARLYLGFFGRRPAWLIGLQIALAFGLMLAGTRAFVAGVALLSHRWPPLILSLLIIPIATELPEKINSILWVRRGGHDTLAFANITGALVFQGTLLPALGIWLTPWTVRPDVVLSMTITLATVLYLLLIAARGPLRPHYLLVNGLGYALYFVLLTR